MGGRWGIPCGGGGGLAGKERDEVGGIDGCDTPVDAVDGRVPLSIFLI